jgi:hypothetical protein
VGQTFTAIGGAGAISGQFSNLPIYGTISSGSVQMTANDYNAAGDLILTITAVPEPGTWAMMFGGLGMLFSFQRLRRCKV